MNVRRTDSGRMRGTHPVSRALVEPLKGRCLLSSYAPSVIGYFGANDTGAVPFSPLIVDTAGDLFGTTSQGGAYGAGTVFEIPAGTSTLITLASFNGTDGAAPHGDLALDAAGNLYGTTSGGGPNNRFGTVFEIAKGSGAITTLASFNGSNGASANGVTVDSAGNLYGTTEEGGRGPDPGLSAGTVFEIVKGSAAVTTLANFNGTNTGNPFGGVTLDSARNLYGTTSSGGANGDGTVFEIAKGSNTLVTLISFNGSNGARPFGDLALDSAGNLYGTSSGGGANNSGTIFEIAKGSTNVITLASFNAPNGVNGLTLDSEGNLYGTTDGSRIGGTMDVGTVFELRKERTTITTLASFNGSNGASPAAGVTLDSAGNLYGTASYGGANGFGTVFEISKGSTVVTTLVSFNNTSGLGSNGVTMDAAGNLYGTTEDTNYGYAAGGDGTVFELAKGSTIPTTLATFNGTNGSGPTNVTLDAAGNLYGTTNRGGANNDGTVFEIVKGTSTITTLASFYGTNGEYPRAGVTLDSDGNLYGTTYGTPSANGYSPDYGTVFEIATGTNTITTLAKFDGTNGANPTGSVTLDAAGNLYGTTFGIDFPSDDGTVFEIPKGSTTVATLATFNGANGAEPLGGVTLDADGNLYGTTSRGPSTTYYPSGDGTVFSGTVITLATFNGTNGAQHQAGVTLDSAGNLYGVTSYGGANDFGTVFEIPKGSTAVTTLALFDPYVQGSPGGNLIFDAEGNLYGTAGGGPGGDGTVFKLSPALPGDANLDGKVNFADLVILARNYHMSYATWSDGDFNGDGTVGFDDLVTLAANYGHALPTLSATAAPVSPAVRHERFLQPLRHRRG